MQICFKGFKNIAVYHFVTFSLLNSFSFSFYITFNKGIPALCFGVQMNVVSPPFSHPKGKCSDRLLPSFFFHGKQMFIARCRSHCFRGHLLWLWACSDCLTSFIEKCWTNVINDRSFLLSKPSSSIGHLSLWTCTFVLLFASLVEHHFQYLLCESGNSLTSASFKSMRKKELCALCHNRQFLCILLYYLQYLVAELKF